MFFKQYHWVKTKCSNTWGRFHIQTLQTTGTHRGLVGWAQWPEAYKRKALGFVLSFKGKLSSPAADDDVLAQAVRQELPLGVQATVSPTPSIVFVLVL